MFSIRTELLSDPAFVCLSPAERWFYISISTVIKTGSPKKCRTLLHEIKAASGVQCNSQLKDCVSRLSEAGFLRVPEPGTIELLRFSQDFEIQEESKTYPGVSEVFEHWRKRTGKKTTRLSVKREKKIKTRLREGRTIDELKRAIDGCMVSPWHQGENDRGVKYDSVELIFRNDEKVDFFIEISRANTFEEEEEEQATSDLEDRSSFYSQLREERDRSSFFDGVDDE